MMTDRKVIPNGSGVWQKGIPIDATYGRLRSLIRTWIAEFARKRIRGNMTSPRPIETPILEGRFGDSTDASERLLGVSEVLSSAFSGRVICHQTLCALPWR